MLEANNTYCQVAPLTVYVPTGGAWSVSASQSLDSIMVGHVTHIRQNGEITHIVDMQVASITNLASFYINIWRENLDGNYDRISQSEDLASELSVGSNDITFDTPLTAEEGDCYGFTITAGSGGSCALLDTSSLATSAYYISSIASATDYDWEAGSVIGTYVPIRLYMRSPILVCAGDSITSGYTAHDSYIFPSAIAVNDVATSYPYQLATLLNKSVNNSAISGYTSTNLVDNVLSTHIVDRNPRYCAFMIGWNDIFNISNFGDSGEVATAKALFITNYTTLLDSMDTNGIVPIVILITPNNTNSTVMTIRDDWNDSLNTLAATYADVIIINTSVYLGQGTNLWDLFDDYISSGVHLNQDGHWALATSVADAIYEDSDEFEQPGSAMGAIDTSIVQTFPTIADITGKSDPTIPVIGLYAWNSHFTDATNFMPQFSDIGFETVRIGFYYKYGFDNLDLFAGSNATELAQLDEVMENLAETGKEVLFTTMGYRRDELDGATPVFASDAAWVLDYVTYLGAMMDRYAPGGTFWSSNPTVPYKPVMYWEIWNEPNLHYLYSIAANREAATQPDKADLYAPMLVDCYDYIQTNHSTCFVVGFSACGVSRNDVWSPQGLSGDGRTNEGFIHLVHDYVDTNYTDRVDNFYDILSNHPYVHEFPPDSEDVRTSYHYSIANSHDIYRTVMDDYGNEDKPVWFTEIGWKRPNGTYKDETFLITERVQAAYILRMYLTALRLGVERVHIMFSFDGDGWNAGFVESVTRDYYESADATKEMIAQMPNPKMVSAGIDGTNGYYEYTINPDVDNTTDNIIVAWNVEETIDKSITVANGSYTVIDMFGGETVVVVSDGSIEIEAGICPTYIITSGLSEKYVMILRR